jgi:hypothetical protein
MPDNQPSSKELEHPALTLALNCATREQLIETIRQLLKERDEARAALKAQSAHEPPVTHDQALALLEEYYLSRKQNAYTGDCPSRVKISQEMILTAMMRPAPPPSALLLVPCPRCDGTGKLKPYKRAGDIDWRIDDCPERHVRTAPVNYNPFTSEPPHCPSCECGVVRPTVTEPAAAPQIYFCMPCWRDVPIEHRETCPWGPIRPASPQPPVPGRQPIPVTEIVAALEREAANTDTDPRWIAAQCLRHIAGWESRTFMCRIDTRPSTYSGATKRSDDRG